MKILSRRVAVQKTPDEIQSIVNSFAYRFSKPAFSGDSFSINCAKRYNGGILSLTPIKGAIVHGAQMLEVDLAVCAGFSFYVGGTIIILAIVGILWCIFMASSRWVACIGMLLLGLFMLGQSLWEGTAILDRIEYKLRS